MKLFYTSLNVFIPLLLGGIVYLTYRSSCLLMFEWVDYLHLTTYIEWLRAYGSGLNYTPSRFTLYSLPDGVWVHSMTATYLSIWKEDYKKGLVWILLGLLLGVGSELGQLFGLVSGVFDLQDVFAYVLFFIIGGVIQVTINNNRS